jgi:hypothetical protein
MTVPLLPSPVICDAGAGCALLRTFSHLFPTGSADLDLKLAHQAHASLVRKLSEIVNTASEKLVVFLSILLLRPHADLTELIWSAAITSDPSLATHPGQGERC